MSDGRETLRERFARVRARTEALAAPLSAEDQQVQAMDSASPTKWHRAHTTWFFETFVLAPRGVPPVDARWGRLFNSYYEAVGARVARPRRGLLTRPTADEVTGYRRVVDGRVDELLAAAEPGDADGRALAELVTLGLHHEEQHQELILTDILAAFALNPLAPAYASPTAPAAIVEPRPAGYVDVDGGLVAIGADAGPAFAFDNERPRHRVFVAPFAIADRLVTWAELSAFVDDGGYATPSLWLSDGLDWVRAHGIDAPAYARRDGGRWRVFSLEGEREPAPAEPVGHLSCYEADALSRYLGARLPTEAEWELAAASRPVAVDLLGVRPLRPTPAGSGLAQPFGELWEWTASAYAPYPGYVAGPGALGEYNGKFMINQQVLRGGSFATPPGHARHTYRNFWPAPTRFQFTGLRCARDR